MNSSGSEERLIARLLDLPAVERMAEWQRACRETPGLRERFPKLEAILAAAARSTSSSRSNANATASASGSATANASATVTPRAAAGAAAAAVPSENMLRALGSALDSADRETIGSRIGPYKLLQKIGEGGFGAVWMAEQLEPIHRRVALKIVKVGMDTDEVIARFEAERQALALMDHPNIAHVFDAGATAAGRPYFVMELVRGVAITQYCDDNRLSAEERLQLFLPICHAVQHAHQKGVIHRDLKPSNILITLHDGVPVPKVIDFGIAKATDKRLTEKTLVTQFHAFVGTPVYTSPEQMEMSGLDVDTRSDIYSLGVLLYELLAGSPPFDADALVKSGLDAMRRTIREIDPPRPSIRFGTLSDADRTSVALRRGTEPARLALSLRGDLDWVVMRCLEKDRTRRYESAAALATDIVHHLRDEPVVARPPSQVYRARKFVRRHRVGVSAIVCVMISLAAGLVAASSLFVRERVARQRAVVAERSENALRQQADAARVAEARRASRTAQTMAEQLFSEGRSQEALAHLVRAARSDPENDTLAPRLIAALAFRNFAEPVGLPLTHAQAVWNAGYFKHTRRCWTVTFDGTFRIWNSDDGRLERTIEIPRTVFGDMSPDETRAATALTDGSIIVWSLQTGERLFTLSAHEKRTAWLAFSPDGKWLASASDDHTARLWDASTGEAKAILSHGGAVNAVTFSPDSASVVTAAMDGQWRIWRVPDGTPVTPFRSAVFRANIGRFSPDGKLVVVADNTGAQLFNAATGASVGARLQHLSQCLAAAFSPDGTTVVTTSDDGTARLWDVPSGRPLLAPFQHSGAVPRVAFTPNGRSLLTICEDGAARVWDVATGAYALEPMRAGGHPVVDVSPDGSDFLLLNSANVVQRWGLDGGAVVPFQLPPDSKRLAVGVVQNGSKPAAWAAYGDRMQVIDITTGLFIGGPRLFPAQVAQALLSPDARRVFVTLPSGESELWNLDCPEVERHRIGAFGRLEGRRRCKFSPDGSRIAILDNSSCVRVWDTTTGRLELGPAENAQGFTFSPGARRLAIQMTDFSVELWDLQTATRVGGPLRHNADVADVQFSPDEHVLATATVDGFVQFWDTDTQRSCGTPLPHHSIIRAMSFTADGRRLLTCCRLNARVWDVATGAPLTEPMPGGNLNGAVFDDEETRIATICRSDGVMRIWDSASGRLLVDAEYGPRNWPSFFGFLDHGKYLAHANTSIGRLWVWPVPPAARHLPAPDWLLRLATAVAGGEIDERAVFREEMVNADIFATLRRELAALPDDAPFVEWGRWFLADRTTRPIGPGFQLTRAAAQTFAQDTQGPSP